jgi:hypothetical protein
MLLESESGVHKLAFFYPFRITVRHKIQSDIMLKESLEARQHQCEPLGRGGHLFHKLIAAACEARFRDADEGCATLV